MNVFSNRNFRLVFLGALVSELGALLYNFAVSFYIPEISGNSAFLQGLYLALCGVSMLVFTPVGGALFPHIIKEDQLQQANSYFSIKNSLEGILGIILAGVLYALLPIQVLFFLVGGCFIASGISEMLIRYDHRPSKEQLTLRLAVRDMRDGVRYLATKKAILTLLFAALFINFFFAPITGNFLPYFVKTDLAGASSYLFDRVLAPELWSSVFSVCVGVSSLLGAALLSVRPQAQKCGHGIAVCLCVISAFMVALTVCYRQFVDRGAFINGFLIAFCVSGLAIGFLLALINIPLSTVIMRVIDKDMLSKVTSITSIGSQGMIPVASVLAGLILETLGSTRLLGLCSLGFSATAALLLTNRQVREI